MSMLTRLIKKSPEKPAQSARAGQAADKQARVAQVQDIVAGLDQQGRLALLKDSEAELDLRIAAIGLLDFGQVLLDQAYKGETMRFQRAARERIAGLIDDGALSVERFRSEVSEPLAQMAVIGLCDEALVRRAVDLVTDQTLLAALAAAAEVTLVRHLAAEKVEDLDLLANLQKESKGKDKTVYQIARRKLDQHKEQERARQASQTEAEKICLSMEKLASGEIDRHLAQRVQSIEQQWLAMGEAADESTRRRYGEALAGCQAMLAQREAAQAAAVAQQVARTEQADQAGQLVETARGLLLDLLVAEQADDTLSGRVTALEQEVLQHSNHVDGGNQQKNLGQLCRDAEFLLVQLTRHGSLAAQLEAVRNSDDAGACGALQARLKPARWLDESRRPSQVAEAQSVLQHWQENRQAEKQTRQKQIRSVGGLVRRANQAITAGHLAQAFGIRRSIDHKLANLPEVPGGLARQLEDLNTALDKYQDWRDYAVLPKKEALIEQMEGLVGADIDPETLSAKIRELQEAWRELSKGGKDQHPELWQRFHAAAEKANEPCQGYFQEKANIRQRNLEMRAKLAEQLVAYCQTQNWEKPDWKQVEKVLRTARDEWRRYSPSNRAETKPLQEKFDAAADEIYRHLVNEYRGNIEHKQSLIERAKQLLDVEDTRQAIDTIKQLQAQWKQTGPVPRKKDQALWTQFRKHCDALFEKQKQATDAFVGELNAHQASAQQMIEEVKTLGRLEDKVLLDARARVDELREAFNALGSLPRARERELKTDFRKAVDAFYGKIHHMRDAAKERAWQNLFDANDALRVAGLALFSGDGSAQTALKDAEVFISNVERWPAGGQAAISAKFAALQAGKHSGKPAEHEEQLRELCIRAEILTETATPAEDQQRRMAYQLAFLQQNMGQKSPLTPAEEMAQLTLAWIAVGAVDGPVYRRLLERFQGCRRKIDNSRAG